MASTPPVEPEIFYPADDDEPMSDNQANIERIVDSASALRHAYDARGEVAFVHYNMFVYPVEGHPEIRNSPDLFAAPGCSRHPVRGSFKVWVEPAPIVLAAEFLSPIRGETIDSPAIAPRIDFYADPLGTPELMLYEPSGIQFEDAFEFAFLRLGPDGYRRVQPGEDGWFASEQTPFEFLPDTHWIRVRDAASGEEYLPESVRAVQADEDRRRAEEESRRAEEESRRAEEESRRAEEESRRADEAESRVRELEKELRRLRGDA